jgi:hypothetical protein
LVWRSAQYFADKKTGETECLARLPATTLSGILLTFTFTGYESISSRSADANIVSIAACDLVIPAAAKNAIISAQSVDHVYVGAAQDQVIAFRAGYGA